MVRKLAGGDRISIYEELEPWATARATATASAAGLHRWTDDIIQDARIALWEAVCSFDGRGCPFGFAKQRVRRRLLNAIERYRRWDSKELTGITDGLLYDANTNS